jgi:serine phosphatase RsbU (regulator of sigma subunit)
MPGNVLPDVLLGVAPLIACAFFGWAVTASFGAVAVALSVGSGFYLNTWGVPQQWVRLIDVALVSVSAVLVAAHRGRREAQLARLQNISDAAQRAVLPLLPAAAPGVLTTARYVPAAEDLLVGGDLYDCCLENGHARFVVGDVRGKGIEAIGQAARVIRAFRQAAAAKHNLADVAVSMDSYLADYFDVEEFATALLVDVTMPSELVLTSCGHPPALLAHPDGSGELLKVPAGLPLGLGGVFDTSTFPWDPGDRLLLYSDGLSEARNVSGEFLDLDELGPLVSRGTLYEALDAVLSRVRDHVPRRELGDDLAVVLLERCPDATLLRGRAVGSAHCCERASSDSRQVGRVKANRS